MVKEKNSVKLIYLIFTSFLAWTFLNFLVYSAADNNIFVIEMQKIHPFLLFRRDALRLALVRVFEIMAEETTFSRTG